jgi:hypothetical protein
MAVYTIGDSASWSAIPIPNVGDAEPTASSRIVSALTTLRDSLAQKVTQAAINITGTFELNSNLLTEVNSIKMDNLGASLTGAGNANKIHVVSGELYFTNNSGTATKLTNAGSLNIAATGALTGDYGTGNEQLRYNTTGTTDRYTFYSDYAGAKNGEIETGDIRLTAKNSASATAITIKNPSASTTYTLTLPSTLPANTEAVTITSGGTLAAGGTITTLDCSTFKHGSMNGYAGTECVVFYNATVNILDSTYLAWTWTANTVSSGTPGTESNIAHVHLPLKENDRITAATVYCQTPGSGIAGNIAMQLYKVNLSTGTWTSISTETNSGAVTSRQSVALSSVTATTVAADERIVVILRGKVTAGATKIIYGVKYTFTRV